MVKFAGALVGGAVALAAGLAGAEAATITSGSLLGRGITLELGGITPCGAVGSLSTNVGVFSGTGPPGSGTASCGDRTTPQVKTPTTPHPDGRYDPDTGPWVDSNDLERVIWDLDIDGPVKGLSFALTDAHDQPDSRFEIRVGDTSWEIPEREPNGTLHLITVLFDEPTDAGKIRFLTEHNDGWGISEATVQPVPLPPGLLLALSGIGLIAAVRRFRGPKPA